MSLSSSMQQTHTILHDGIRCETVELILSAIPNFELKHKGRILRLFTEIYNAFIQEIQEMLIANTDDVHSCLVERQANVPMAETFTCGPQVDNVTGLINQSFEKRDGHIEETFESDDSESNGNISLLTALKKTEDMKKRKDVNMIHQSKAILGSVKNLVHIKKEATTPPKTKRRLSKSALSSKRSHSTSMRQMTMTQLFDPVESPNSTTTSTPMKQEPMTPDNDTLVFMPESLIGLAVPSKSRCHDENEQNNLSDLLPFLKEIETSNVRPLKRKSVLSPVVNTTFSVQSRTEGEENIQNEALLASPYSNVDSEQLLYACPMCRNYWLGLPEELRRKEGLTCRHRQRPVAHTPEHFWSLGIPNTQTCIERGYGGVLPPDRPIQRPRRPRRQYQRRLQEQQQHNEDDEEEEEED